MIAVDSSVIVNFLAGIPSPKVALLRQNLTLATAYIPPPTLTELLSDHTRTSSTTALLHEFKIIELSLGYWERAGLLRAKLRSEGRKAALGDALIAQCCIDADVPLLTEDADFAAFAQHGGLKLA